MIEKKEFGSPSFLFADSSPRTRYPFAASIELTDMRSERLVTARTSNLSLFGCYVCTTSPFPEGTKVTLRITHDTSFTAWAKVLYLKPNSGMGVTFANIEPICQTMLEKWIASLRAK